MNLHTQQCNAKVTLEHLARTAFVYVRQSSMFQVENHQESRRRQYDFVQNALHLGWPKERIMVIDEDQGKSGAMANTRSGFSRVIHAVGKSEAGIVMSLEASRLARNSPDWHTLIYMCRYTQTLIADETGVFDPISPTDRMVLGIRGQMSEMEIEMSIHRMVEGRLNKARRGEYLIYPPPGYELDEQHHVILTPDEAVASAIRTFFATFDELQCVKRVYDYWLDQGLTFPVRRVGLRTHPVVWVKPAYRLFRYVLHNPFYAGAYVFGRTRSVRELDPEDPRKLRIRHVAVAQQDWPVLLKQHHPGYISFAQYEKNQQQIQGNCQMKKHQHDGTHGAAREGAALLQGLTRCAKCGRSMLVSYGGSRPSPKSTRTMQYRCFGARRQTYEGPECQVIGGKRIDALVVGQFLEVSQQAAAEGVRLASADLSRMDEQAQHFLQLQIERAQYEARRAQRQFDAVEPENRLVARTLEARWNACLSEVERLRMQAQQSGAERAPLNAAELARAQRLGADLEAVWHAPSTTNQDRKQLLRAAIEEVQLDTEPELYRVKIIWRGGATTQGQVKRYRVGYSGNATDEETMELIRKLAAELDDDQIARVLNKHGCKTGNGHPFTAHKVSMHRYRHRIAQCPKRPARDPREGPFTADEAAAELGVCSSTIHRWLRDGILAGRQIVSGAPWQIVLTDEIRKKLFYGDAPNGWVSLNEAARQLGLGRQKVAYLVKQGKLKAVRAMVCGRQCWRIDVSSTSCAVQGTFFDSMNNPIREEA